MDTDDADRRSLERAYLHVGQAIVELRAVSPWRFSATANNAALDAAEEQLGRAAAAIEDVSSGLDVASVEVPRLDRSARSAEPMGDGLSPAANAVAFLPRLDRTRRAIARLMRTREWTVPDDLPGRAAAFRARLALRSPLFFVVLAAALLLVGWVLLASRCSV